MTFRRLLPALALSVAACASKPETAAESNTDAAPANAAPANAQDTSLVRADKARIAGADTAKVWFIMSSDFQCPFCRQFHDEVWPRIQKEYVATGKVRVAFLNHPMTIHPLATPAAEAAMCAGKQDKFWQMHDGLFHTQERWVRGTGGRPLPVFDSLATSLGLRMNDWRSCMSSHATLAMVESDFAKSSAGGVSGTPSFFIGDRLAMVGVGSYGEFKAVLDSVIRQSGR
jgi:protein-disulfide isomerase